MKRFSFISTLVLGALLVTSIAGCAGDPYLEGARTDLQNQNYAGALENIETALAEDPNNAVALELRGRILQEQSETVADPAQREAIIRDMMESYDRAAQIDPSMALLIDQRLQIAWATELQEGIEAFNRGAEDESAYLSAAAHFANSTIIAPDSLGGYIFGLLGRVPDWRWLQTGQTTPWYPNLRLFRQSKLGDWSGVFNQVTHALRGWPVA